MKKGKIRQKVPEAGEAGGILKFLRSGEGQKLEFKSGFNAEVIETLVAFINTQRGSMVVGIKKACGVSGVDRRAATPDTLPGMIESEMGQKSGQKSGQKATSGFVSKAQISVLELIKKNNRITRKKLSGLLKISESTVQKHIEKLKAMKLLLRAGPDKGGHWEVIEE